MKYKGKVISGSSILTILGVLCFATVIVSALLISNSLQWSNTTQDNALTLSKTAAVHDGGYELLPDNPIKGQTYSFGVHAVAGSADVPAWTLQISIAGTAADTDVTLKVWNATESVYDTVTLTGTTTLTGTVSMPDIAHTATDDASFCIVFNVAATFAWTVTATIP